jgi:hypothetical protein
MFSQKRRTPCYNLSNLTSELEFNEFRNDQNEKIGYWGCLVKNKHNIILLTL